MRRGLQSQAFLAYGEAFQCIQLSHCLRSPSMSSYSIIYHYLNALINCQFKGMLLWKTYSICLWGSLSSQYTCQLFINILLILFRVDIAKVRVEEKTKWFVSEAHWHLSLSLDFQDLFRRMSLPPFLILKVNVKDTDKQQCHTSLLVIFIVKRCPYHRVYN